MWLPSIQPTTPGKPYRLSQLLALLLHSLADDQVMTLGPRCWFSSLHIFMNEKCAVPWFGKPNLSATERKASGFAKVQIVSNT